LFNLSLSNSIVPQQWKQASICPVPKVATPTSHSDFRPISITLVLSWIIERIVVREFIYLALVTPPAALDFTDQYAFRPTGSTTAALTYILQSVTDLLADNPYVSVIALDFSKSFDTVRHYSLLEKIAQLDIPDFVYNWLVHFFCDHSHSTKYGDATSTNKSISVSTVQGSTVGPVAYVINTGDMVAVTPGNRICKYADDTYVIVPAANLHARDVEVANTEQWATTNNLTLNQIKSVEIIFTEKHRFRVSHHPTLPGIRRVTTLKMLGVTLTNHMSASEHVSDIISRCAQSIHAVQTLRCYGMNDEALQVIYKSVVLQKLLYASSAWWGFTSAADRHRIEAFVRHGVQSGFYSADSPTAAELVSDSDDNLFRNIVNNENHLLNSYQKELLMITTLGKDGMI